MLGKILSLIRSFLTSYCFRQSCVCYETSLTPEKSPFCPSNMGSFCFLWAPGSPFGSNFDCPQVNRIAFKMTAAGSDPVKKAEEGMLTIGSAPLFHCLEIANRANHFLNICTMKNKLPKHFYFWDKFVLPFNTKVWVCFLTAINFVFRTWK